jgi:beta-N-acetylhexosaminidase
VNAPRIVVMGVSGCGKSTLAALLAERLAVPFIEGDRLHPPANVAKMAAGVPLTDEDRAGWLDAVAGELAAAGAGGAVLACSALKRDYRDRLRRTVPDLRWIHLQGPREVLAQRLAGRRGHYMPPTLLDSQLQTLQPPGADEGAVTLDIQAPVPELVHIALRALRDAGAPTGCAGASAGAPAGE